MMAAIWHWALELGLIICHVEHAEIEKRRLRALKCFASYECEGIPSRTDALVWMSCYTVPGVARA